RVARNIANIARLHAVLRHDPELIVDAPIAHRSAPRLARLATQSFEKRISRRSETDSKQKFDRRIEKVFLQQMNNPMFHLLVLTSAVFTDCTAVLACICQLLALTLVGVTLFPAKEAHSFIIIDVLRTIDDGNHFLLGTNG